MPINYQPPPFAPTIRDAMRGPGGAGLPLNGTISRRVELNSELAILTIMLNGWQLEPFEPGQFADIALQTRSTAQQTVSLESSRFVPDEMIRRAYSIASSPDQRNQIELLLNLVPRGEFTPSLWRLDEGSRVHVSPRIRGRFTLSAALSNGESHAHDIDVADNQNMDEDNICSSFHPHVVFVATGTGLAPYMSMLRHASDNGPQWASATLLHSVRVEEDLAYRDELKTLTGRNALRFRYIPTVTRVPKPAWVGENGRVQSLLEPGKYAELTRGRTIRPEDTHIYLCGNPEMIQTLREQFEARGFIHHTNNTPGNLHFESYW